MNKLILKNLSPELKTIWIKSKTQPLSGSELRLIRNFTKEYRRRYLYIEDALKWKEEYIGNHGRWAIEAINRFNQPLFYDKIPSVNGLGEWVSVEIECLFPNIKAFVDLCKFIRINKYKNFVTFKNDGSIKISEKDHVCETPRDCSGHCGNVYGKEVVISFRKGDFNIIHSICGEMHRLGVRVNETCGLHVHFDMRHINNKQKVRSLAKRIVNNLPILKQLLPMSRRSNRFCVAPINGFKRGNRYAFVNLQSFNKHKTLEIRGHSGTIDSTKIMNWIIILDGIMSSKSKGKAETIGDFLYRYKFNMDISAYIINRYNKFKNNTNELVYDIGPIHVVNQGYIDNVWYTRGTPDITITYMDSVGLAAASNEVSIA